jgi:CDP-diacylglycerol--glycerol-3-phosphate 3-phosphatidyltransferase
MLSRYRETLRLYTDPMGRVLVRLHLKPNHLTVCGLGASLLCAAAFTSGRLQLAGVLLTAAGLCDYFDGTLARASGRVTPFGAFLDSVIDRYSDLVVLLSIILLFAQASQGRAVAISMVALVGSVMVSYTKARAESIGVVCNVGLMERPERIICLIAGAMLDLLEPAMWVLALLSNATAVHRIAVTRQAARSAASSPSLPRNPSE